MVKIEHEIIRFIETVVNWAYFEYCFSFANNLNTYLTYSSKWN